MICGDFTLYDLMVRNASLYPEQEAIVFDGRRTTFGTYRGLCDQYAAGLVREGVSGGDRIAILSGNSDDFLILLGAAAKIGAIAVPVNWRLTAEEIAYILRDTAPKHLFSSEACLEAAEKASAKVGSIERRYLFRAGGRNGSWHPFEALRRKDGSGPTGDATGRDACLIIHTAATGGRPRGTILTQANVVAAGLQIAHLLKLDHRDVHICILPLFHIGGLSMTLATLHQGGKNVLVDRFDPHAVLCLVEKERGTFWVTFPPILASILDAQENGSFHASSLRAASGVDSPETIERFLRTNPQAAFYSLYGQTEAMPVSGGHFAERPGSIGRPAILTRVALFDDLDREVPPGETGEICVRSPAVFQGYWNLAAETAYTFRKGWHHTGDLGRRDEGGFLWYAGRKPEKELIKTGGENVYPAEVEKVILLHGAVSEAIVIGVPDREWGETVRAVCVLKPGGRVGAGELIDFVASQIARYKKPREVVFVESLPKTADGAIDRAEVKRVYGAG